MNRWCYLIVLVLPNLALADGADTMQTAPGLGDLAKMLFSLGLTLVLIYLSAILLRHVRFGSNAIGTDDSLRIVKTLSISPKEKMLIVQVGNQQVLLGSSSAGLQTLYELKEPIPSVDAATQKRSFNSILCTLGRRSSNAS